MTLIVAVLVEQIDDEACCDCASDVHANKTHSPQLRYNEIRPATGVQQLAGAAVAGSLMLAVNDASTIALPVTAVCVPHCGSGATPWLMR